MTLIVDQKSWTRREVLLARLRQAAPALATAGTIVETWRTYRGRRLGPFFRVAYRESEIQKSIYVGNDPELVAAACELLGKLQADERLRRAVARQRRAVRASLTVAKTAWAQELKKRGLSLKGYEARGWRRGTSGE